MTDFLEIAVLSHASQEPVEMACLMAEVAYRVRPKVVVEIGVHTGASLAAWGRAFYPEVLIGVEDDLSVFEWRDDVPFPRLVSGDSHATKTLVEVMIGLLENKIDFLFIDGDHSYQGALMDYEVYGPLVRSGGVIAFHDVMLDSEEWVAMGVEVCRVWKGLDHGPHDHVIWCPPSGTGTGVFYKP